MGKTTDLPERVQQNIAECQDVKTNEFDWDQYQELCDIAEYWETED